MVFRGKKKTLFWPFELTQIKGPKFKRKEKKKNTQNKKKWKTIFITSIDFSILIGFEQFTPI